MRASSLISKQSDYLRKKAELKQIILEVSFGYYEEYNAKEDRFKKVKVKPKF